MNHHQANLEPLHIVEFLLTFFFASKVAVPCVSSGWMAFCLGAVFTSYGGEQLVVKERVAIIKVKQSLYRAL
jgi:hypothetical protein